MELKEWWTSDAWNGSIQTWARCLLPRGGGSPQTQLLCLLEFWTIWPIAVYTYDNSYVAFSPGFGPSLAALWEKVGRILKTDSLSPNLGKPSLVWRLCLISDFCFLGHCSPHTAVPTVWAPLLGFGSCDIRWLIIPPSGPNKLGEYIITLRCHLLLSWKSSKVKERTFGSRCRTCILYLSHILSEETKVLESFKKPKGSR